MHLYISKFKHNQYHVQAASKINTGRDTSKQSALL